MALEAILGFNHDLFGYNYKDFYSLEAPWNYNSVGEEEENGIFETLEMNQEQGRAMESLHVNWDYSSSSMGKNVKEFHTNSSPEGYVGEGFSSFQEATAPTAAGRKKRRRMKTCKNKEEVENQRMTHIAVERNRRKQMNEYLAILRSLMPTAYVQRADQASIIGGAINFVKELEQFLQSLEAQKGTKEKPDLVFSSPFADFFAFPQYSGMENRSSIAEIEVTMVESHANLKVLSKRRPKQLLKIVTGFQSLHLTILHLNVTTIDQMVLYSLSVKVEDDCRLASVDEISTAVYQMIGRIQEEDTMS